jgi:hypothetical protein
MGIIDFNSKAAKIGNALKKNNKQSSEVIIIIKIGRRVLLDQDKTG